MVLTCKTHLTYLAVEKNVASATQNQAFNALIYLYKYVLEIDIEKNIDAVRAKYKRRLPVVLTIQEIERLFDHLKGLYKLIAMLLYGCGLRLKKGVQLRIKDIDMEQNILIIRSGKR